MTELTPFFIFLSIIVVSINLFLVSKTGGIRNNVLNVFMLLAFCIYLLVTPSVYFFLGSWDIAGVSVESYWGIGMLQIFLHLLFYSFGYFLVLRRSPKNPTFSSSNARRLLKQPMQNFLFPLFLIFYIVIFLNTLVSGVNLVDVFLGSYGDPTLGLRGSTYYIQNLADSLITIIISAYYFKVDSKIQLLMVSLAIPLFLVLGFRYRILLSFFGWFMIYAFDTRVRIVNLWKYGLVLSVSIVVLLTLTANRYNIYMQRYDLVFFDFATLPFDSLLDQAKGSLVDFAMYRAVDTDLFRNDLGYNAIVYTIIKSLPAMVFPGGTKPYPPPQILDIHRALNSGTEIGEAVTSLGSAFYSFYYPGIYLAAFALGILIAWRQNLFEKNNLSFLSSVVFALVGFQWLTRGYMPGVVDHLFYMMLPLWLYPLIIRIKSKFV